MSVREPWDAIEAWLGANAPAALATLRPPASAAQIAKLERAIGTVPQELREWLALHDGDTNGFALGGWEIYGVDAMLREHEMRRELRTEGVAWADDWIAFAGDGSGEVLIVDGDGAVLWSANVLDEASPVSPAISAFLWRFLLELRAGFWSADEAYGLKHREGHRIGTYPLEMPSDVDAILALMIGNPRAPSRAEIEAFVGHSVPERLAAGDRCIASLGHDWVLRSRAIEIIAMCVRADAADWLSAQWNDGDLSTRSRIFAASVCWPPELALEKALEIFDPRRDGPDDLAPVGGEALLDWLERSPPAALVRQWGELALQCSPRWERIAAWLARGRPHSLTALDALAAELSDDHDEDGKVIWPRSRTVRVRELPPPATILETVRTYAARDGVPRVTRAVGSIEKWLASREP